MTAVGGVLPRVSRRGGMSLALGLAWRELRSGLGGFYIFIACVALGVAVITAVGALSDGLRAGFERQGEMLLGGDIVLARPHKRAEPQEVSWLRQQGRVSEAATMRAMFDGVAPRAERTPISRPRTDTVNASNP